MIEVKDVLKGLRAIRGGELGRLRSDSTSVGKVDVIVD